MGEGPTLQGNLDKGLLETTAAAARLVNPCIDACATLTFRVTHGISQDGEAWRLSLFRPVLAPALVAAVFEARRGRVQALSAIDAQLTEKLPGELAAASIRAGRRLAESLLPLRGERVSLKLRDWIAAEQIACHLAIIHAARCAAFSLPDVTVLGAYAYQELHRAMPMPPAPQAAEFLRACVRELDGASVRPRLGAA